jgi:glycosyltransferase involved in cell wall biosynthesis
VAVGSLPIGPAKAPTPPAAPGPPATIRVLHVVNGEHYSGAERVQDLLGLTLPQFGYAVGFASLKPGKFGDHRRSVDSPLYEVAMRGRWDLGIARRLAKLVRQEEYALIHAHTPRSLLVAYLASRLAGVPLVYHVHSPASRDSTRHLANLANHCVERGCANRADRVLTVSPTLTEHMRRMGVSPDKLHCVLNGVPRLAEDEARRRRQPIAPFNVAMIALFRPRKGAEVLLDAIAALRSRELDVRLEAIGPFETPEYEQQIRARVKKLGLEEHVHWVGFTDDVTGALARVDALALPSLFGEGLPMVVLEAMAAGLPVVATRCEGTTEAILHRETGLLVEPGSVRQLADALEELFNGETDYPRMALAARERHADHFSTEAMARSVAGVYDGVLRTRG